MKIRDLFSRGDPPVLPRQEVAEIIARVFVEHEDCFAVVGPSSQTGPLGGELEHMSLRLSRDGQEAWVTVNVYGNHEWRDA